MINSPKITVIIPCYNTEKYVEHCIDSIENQTYRSFNVIAVDDCSSDGTYEKLQDLSRRCSFDFQIIRNEYNVGPAVSRNKGIMKADGEYIAFCDSDDWYEPNFLEIMINKIINHSADVVFCGYNVVSESGITEKRPLVYTHQPATIQEALVNSCDSLCMMVVKAAIAKDTLLPDIRNGEDMAVVPLIIQKSSRVVLEKTCLYNYMRRSNSASQVPQIGSVYSLLDSYSFLCDNFNKLFRAELEFIGIRNVLYAAEITLLTISYDKKFAKQILNNFESTFLDWKSNKYIKSLPIYKKIFLSFIRLRLFGFARIIALMRKMRFIWMKKEA